MLPSLDLSTHTVLLARSNSATVPAYALQVTYTPVVCGDGTIGVGEQCDDGNTAGGDGCSSMCLVEFVTEIEPNNTIAEATANPVQITGDKVIQGGIMPVGDLDTYQLVVSTATVVRFETFTSIVDCNTTTIDLRLFDVLGAAAGSRCSTRPVASSSMTTTMAAASAR